MKQVNINIKTAAFPDQFVSDSTKGTMEFGLQVGQAIQYEWFRKDGGSCRFYNQWADFNRLRLYARGEQSIAKYKNEIAVDGDLSYLNLDWTPVPIIPKFIDIVVNGMSDRLFKVKAYAQDVLSAEKRNQFQEMVEADMIAKPILQQMTKDFGIDTFMIPEEQLPETSDELELFMNMKYKPAVEIAEEEAINTLLAENHYQDTRKRIDYDIATLGLGIAKHMFLPGQGVTIDYVDPANVVYSYTEDPYFKDCFYWGEIKTVPITELIKIDPDLTNEDLEEISKYSQSWYDYYNNAQFYQNSMFHRDTATLLYFNYKSSNSFVYKKKEMADGTFRTVQKDDEFNPPDQMQEEGKFERVEKRIDVWYDGVMVMGTNIMLQWKLAENMVRPKSASQYAMPNYVACGPRNYKGMFESLTRRMIPFADLIQVTHLKIQQVVSRVVPDGVFIDADGLNEVDLGTGNAYNPEDALRLYFQTGSVVGRSFTQDGEFNNAKVPITQLTANSGAGKLQMLIGNYNHYLDMIRQVTGLNEARDGSKPDPYSLVGVQKLAALNSNVATRHILDASLYIARTMAECLSIRTADILEYADFKDEFAMQIGKYNLKILEDIKDLYMYDFGIFIEMSPDEEEKQMLEQNIQMALSQKDISLEDAIDIREVHNLKMANQLLKLKRKKKQEAEQQQMMQQQQMQAQQQMEAQQAAAQMEMQKTQQELQGKMQLKQTEIEFEIQKLQTEAQLKAQLMAEEFQYQMQIKGVEQQGLQKRENEREKAKDDRISQQSTQTSKMIEQKKRDLPAINFESNEDSLDGFDLAEFDPR
ncbi:MAG: putative structural protein [Prokaryotic dsDNA virus sp.]|nr:MAG: putative structural protein [Prokaryotic dsDNA virus sp.]|tara:strand:+ start:59111 stop:61546 length:2436 start_codon:yes stop_codon:yes gene_type:complete